MKSLSLLIGTGKCNANCKHCGGKTHRKYAPNKDGIIDEDLITKTIKECYFKGARYLTISSCGEPTLSPESVTRTLEIITNLKEEGIGFSPINLYSNGIRIGHNYEFCKNYLPLWKILGLTTVYITVHDSDEIRNAEIYGIKEYPELKTVFSRIHKGGLLVRANLVISKDSIGTCQKFSSVVNYLIQIGVDSISAWPLRDKKDEIDKEKAPDSKEIKKMEEWIEETDFKIRLLGEKNRVLYQTNQKLTLFPNGQLSNTWCNN